MEHVEAKVLVPVERVSEFYTLAGRWLAGEPLQAAPRRGARRSRRSKGPSASSYAPLGEHLRSVEGDEATLSFDEVEKILDRKLPASAIKHRAWWANTDTHSQALVWLSAGFVVDHADLEAKTITFRRA